MAATRALELCWGTLSDSPLEELLAEAARSGFDAVTAQPAMVRATDEPARRAADLGLRISQLDPLIAPLPGTPDPDTVADWTRRLFEIGLEECLDLAESVGATSVNLAHYRGDPATDLGALRQAAAEVCQAAAGRGLAVTLEYFPESAVPDLVAAAAFVAAVGAPNFALLIDTLHTARSGGTAEQIAALPAGSVGALQVADRGPVDPDAPYVPMSGRALPGEGILPVVAMVRAALSVARPGLPAGIEVFDAGLRSLGPEEAARRAAASMRRLLAEVDG